jgi:hypothetical protein
MDAKVIKIIFFVVKKITSDPRGGGKKLHVSPVTSIGRTMDVKVIKIIFFVVKNSSEASSKAKKIATVYYFSELPIRLSRTATLV